MNGRVDVVAYLLKKFVVYLVVEDVVLPASSVVCAVVDCASGYVFVA